MLWSIMKINTFKPAWWLNSCHLQTVFPYIFQRKIALNTIRERIELPDADYLDIDWVGEQNNEIIIVLHGLAGSINSPYVRGLMAALDKTGRRSLLMHFRGCSGTPNRLARNYHAGDTQDLDYVIRMIKTRFPATKISIIGFSLGGNVLLKWLGESNRDHIISSAIAVSVPFDLKNAASRLQTGFSKIYQAHLLNQIKNEILKKKDLICPFVNINSIKAIKNFNQFDELITAPLHGFTNADEYYVTSSCKQYLKTINTPTLIIHAADDPFMSPDCIPNSNELSSKVTFELCRSGGHVGFISSKLIKPIYWLENRIIQYLDM